ncbi:MAG: helix-turn-helix domain-containing protein [Bryobacteraceae bacterium]
MDPFPTSTAVKGCDWQGRLAAALPSFDVVLHVVCLLGRRRADLFPARRFFSKNGQQSKREEMKMCPSDGEKLLTAEEAAERLAVSRAWVLAHANGNRRPTLPSVKLGKLVRFSPEALKKFVAECAR